MMMVPPTFQRQQPENNTHFFHDCKGDTLSKEHVGLSAVLSSCLKCTSFKLCFLFL